MGEVEQPVSADGGDEPQAAERKGLLLHGVVRARGHERALAKLIGSVGDDDLIEHRGMAALVRAVPYRLPEWNRELIREHSAIIERAMRRTTIVPAPYGIVFRDREHIVEFLGDQHVAFEEALSFLDGAFEMRLHVQPSGRQPDVSEGELADQAASFYTALRRRSRAAFTLPAEGRRVLSAAFLVSRADWVNFVEYEEDLAADHPEFQFDLTGPWPPYDFVRVAFFPRERPGE
ncbi:MAG: GvpL/GvpF family gas vesicle protein [Gemmatimonadales bacterium]|jgi:hypothetical protein